MHYDNVTYACDLRTVDSISPYVNIDTLVNRFTPSRVWPLLHRHVHKLNRAKCCSRTQDKTATYENNRPANPNGYEGLHVVSGVGGSGGSGQVEMHCINSAATILRLWDTLRIGV